MNTCYDIQKVTFQAFTKSVVRAIAKNSPQNLTLAKRLTIGRHNFFNASGIHGNFGYHTCVWGLFVLASISYMYSRSSCMDCHAGILLMDRTFVNRWNLYLIFRHWQQFICVRIRLFCTQLHQLYAKRHIKRWNLYLFKSIILIYVYHFQLMTCDCQLNLGCSTDLGLFMWYKNFVPIIAGEILKIEYWITVQSDNWVSMSLILFIWYYLVQWMSPTLIRIVYIVMCREHSK